jgi:hypothetical protein
MVQVKKALGINGPQGTQSLLSCFDEDAVPKGVYDPQTQTITNGDKVIGRVEPTRKAKAPKKQTRFEGVTTDTGSDHTPTAVSAEKHPDGNTKLPKAAPVMHPGLPQGPVPDRQQYAEQRARDQARRRLDEEAAQLVNTEARVRQQSNAEYIIAPQFVTYPVKALQASGRLLEGFRLDLSPNSLASEAVRQQIAQSVLAQFSSLVEERAKAIALNTIPPPPRPPPRPATQPAAAPTAPVAPVVGNPTVVVPPVDVNPAPVPEVDPPSSGGESPTVPIRRMAPALPPNTPTATKLWMEHLGDAMPTGISQTKRATAAPARKGGKRKFQGKKVASYGLAGVNTKKSIEAAVVAAIAALSLPGASAFELTQRRDGDAPIDSGNYGVDFPVFLVALLIIFISTILIKFQLHFSKRAPVARFIMSIVITGISAVSWHLVTHPSLSFYEMWKVIIAYDARGFVLGIVVFLGAFAIIAWRIVLRAHYVCATRL